MSNRKMSGIVTTVTCIIMCTSVAPTTSFSHPSTSQQHVINTSPSSITTKSSFSHRHTIRSASRQHNDQSTLTSLHGWVQNDGEWAWEEDDPSSLPPSSSTSTVLDTTNPITIAATATPTLPGGEFRPKQSLGQNYLRDGNTVAKICRAFVKDAMETLNDASGGTTTITTAAADGVLDKATQQKTQLRAVELGPGAGALTDVLVNSIGKPNLQCIEIDQRSVELLSEKHPELRIHHLDVLQADYPQLSIDEKGPLIRSATVTMQYEVGRRIVAPTRCKDYGILSVVFQLYADCKIHFKIPPTVFYPQPKVDSALIGLHFLGPTALRRRLAGVSPSNLRAVVTATFQQRRKTVRNGLRNLALTVYEGDKERVQQFFDSEPLVLPQSVKDAQAAGDEFALNQELPKNWSSMRPEELTPGQFVEVTRLLFGVEGEDWATNKLGNKVWRKLKHGS
eukprot:g6721.t1 g6721   contig23:1090062-1091491(-)